MAATVTVDQEGRFVAADPEALALLGVTLPQLQALPRGAFAAEPPDAEADAAFREQWEATGRPDIGGTATLRLLDDRRVRVRFAITPTDDGRFIAVLEEIDGRVDAPPQVFSGGSVLAAWRAAERRLTALIPGSPEWEQIQAEIEQLRRHYQDLFKRT